MSLSLFAIWLMLPALEFAAHPPVRGYTALFFGWEFGAWLRECAAGNWE